MRYPRLKVLYASLALSACTDATEQFESGLVDGFGAGQRVACGFGQPIGEADVRDRNYAAGFDSGYADGSAHCGGAWLRILNGSDETIRQLKVSFPSESVEFGDIPARAITEYRHLAGGIYQYAGYTLVIDGETVRQPAIDWMGESPVDAKRITYRLELVMPQDARSPYRVQLRLADLKIDR